MDSATLGMWIDDVGPSSHGFNGRSQGIGFGLLEFFSESLQVAKMAGCDSFVVFAAKLAWFANLQKQ